MKLIFDSLKIFVGICVLICTTYFFGLVAVAFLGIDYTFTFDSAIGITIILYYVCFFLRLFGDK